MTRPLVLGLDGGGSKAELAIADPEGNVLATARAAGLDPVADPGWESTLRGLLARAELPGGLRRCALALPAYGEAAAVSAAQAAAVGRLLPVEHDLLNDVHAAQIGAFAGGPGVLLLAGTGSMVWRVDDAGTSSRVGGWGEGFGDEGSAHWIGREALGLATRALDGREGASGFARALLARIGVDAGGLLSWFWALPNRRAGVAALAMDVDALAEGGDEGARALLLRAADHLVAHVRAAGGDGLPWSFAGSVFNSATVSRRVRSGLGAPGAPALPPVGGALLAAARGAGWDAGPGWVARLAEDLKRGAARY